MKKHCGPACFSCEYVAFEMKCPMNAAAETGVWQPGDLGRLFSKLTSEPYLSKYSAQALSKPPEGPWVIQLDNVLSKEEADIMIELGGTFVTSATLMFSLHKAYFLVFSFSLCVFCSCCWLRTIRRRWSPEGGRKT